MFSFGKFACVLTLLLTITVGTDAYSEEITEDSQDTSELLDLSLDDLLNMTVTSVSKKAEPLFKAPSAIYVVTAEDIKRIGARNIPDALRIVPGVQVYQVSANQWAVSIRGESGHPYNNKLLVLVDGVSIFTPVFNGVFWENYNIPMANFLIKIRMILKSVQE